MKKVLILGRGGAGKSTLAKKLGKITNIPVIELDKHFWQPDLIPLSNDEWISVQKKLTNQEKWIMDGDLGKYDVLSERLKTADTVIILDFSFLTCLFRSLRRSKERMDFWWWLLTWSFLELPKIKKAITTYAPQSKIFIFNNQKQLDEFIKNQEEVKSGI